MPARRGAQAASLTASAPPCCSFPRRVAQLKGVPLRCEFGPRDLASGQAVLVRRDTRAKETVPLAGLAKRTQEILDAFHRDLLAKATAERNARIKTITRWEEFVPALDELKMVLAPWCVARGGAEGRAGLMFGFSC